jgi:Fic family protein
MKTADFTKPAGEIVQTLEGHQVFVPARLPPSIDFNMVMDAAGDALRLLGELKGAAKRTANPFIFVEPLQKREALTTSAMEGTHTSMENLVLEEENLSGKRDENARETFNYIVASRKAIAHLDKLPISHRIIRSAHVDLLHGLTPERGANKRPGEYKQAQNWIGGSRDIKSARYVPPPPERTQACMDDIEQYINRGDQSDIRSLLDMAIVHYQFEAVHPFADGNGRIGRMLITLMSIQSKLVDLPLLYLSPHLEQNKDEYIDRMYAVSTRSEWVEWINFFMNSISATCRETISKIDRLLALQSSYRERAASVGRSAKLLETVDLLFHSPATTIPKIGERHGITYRAAQQIVEKLLSVGVLAERSNHHPKYFVAEEILSILNRT